MGPNPGKVAFILTELSLPFERIYILPFDKVKEPEYTALNPNGRLPTLIDPNTGIKIWEWGAVIEYQTTKYDSAHKIGFPHRSPEDYAAKKWLFFQVLGKGPYYGQVAWFFDYHPENVLAFLSAIIRRSNGV